MFLNCSSRLYLAADNSKQGMEAKANHFGSTVRQRQLSQSDENLQPGFGRFGLFFSRSLCRTPTSCNGSSSSRFCSVSLASALQTSIRPSTSLPKPPGSGPEIASIPSALLRFPAPSLPLPLPSSRTLRATSSSYVVPMSMQRCNFQIPTRPPSLFGSKAPL